MRVMVPTEFPNLEHRIEAARIERGLRVAEAAVGAGMSEVQWRRIVKGEVKTATPIATVRRMCEIAGIEFEVNHDH